MTKPKQFYVYIYVDPRNGEPFYVGKGFGWRYKRHLTKYAHNIHLKNRITAIRRDGHEPAIGVFDTTNEAEAFDLERTLIAAYGRRDQGTGSLCNYTDGGEGSSGRTWFKHSEETKARIREKMLGREMTPEHRARIGAGRKGHVNGPESFAKSTETRKKNETPERARIRSEAARKALTPERHAKMNARAREVNSTRKAKIDVGN